MRNVKITLSSGITLTGIETFPFEINSMLLDEGVFDGTFTYKINVPYSPTNLDAFGFANVLEVGKDLSIKYPCQVTADGYNFSGDIQIISVEPASFGVSLNFFYGVLVDDFSKTYLDEMDFGVIPFLEDDVTLYTEADLVSGNRAAYIAYANAAMARMVELNEFPIADQLVCFPVWGSLAKRYNLMRVTKPGADFVAEPYYDNLTAGFGPINITPRPAVNLVNILKRVLDQFGLQLAGDWETHTGMNRLIHFSENTLVNRTLSNSFTLSDVLLGYTRWEIFETEIEVAKFLPHMTVLDFLRFIKGHFFLSLFPDILNNRLHLNKFASVCAADYDDDLTDRVASFVNGKQDDKNGFAFEYDRSIDPYAADFPEWTDYEYLPDVATAGDLPAGAGKKKLCWVADFRAYYATVHDDDGVAATPLWQRQGFMWIGQKTGAEEFRKSFVLPGWMALAVEGDNLISPLLNTVFYPRIEDAEERHHQLRFGIFTGRVYFSEDEEEMCYYSSVTNAIKEPYFGGGNKFYLQYPAFPEWSLFVNRREGNSLSLPNQPGVYETFGQEYVRFISKLKPDRFKIRLTMSEVMGMRLDLKKRIGNNLFFISRVNGNVPIREEMELDCWWVPPVV